MAWEETRGSARAVVGAAARQVAHADDAKHRVDEATRLPTRTLRPRLLVGAGAGAAVLAMVGVLALRGGDDPGGTAVAGDPPGTPTLSATTPSRAQELAGSQPSGAWNIVIVNRTVTQRDGTTKRRTGRSDPVVWTFPEASCTDLACSGSIASASGTDFRFTWDGDRLRVPPPVTSDHSKKQPCVDPETGEVMPIAESAFRTTNHYSLEPFTGTAQRMTAESRTRVTFEVFGTCEVSPQDQVLATFTWILTPAG